MDGNTLCAVLALVLSQETSSAARAEAAAEAAEAARDEALAKSYGITIQGTGLIISDQTEGGD